MLNRGLFFALLFAAPAAGLAQQPAKNWDGIKALKAGTSIRITLSNQKIFCAFDSADADGLVCHKRQSGVDRSISLPRTEIQLIRARNATGSVVGGTLIGTGIGLGIGAIVDSSIKNPNTTNNAKFTRGLAPIGALLALSSASPPTFYQASCSTRVRSNSPEASSSRSDEKTD